MVGSTRSVALLLMMFPLGYLLSRLVIVHLDLFGQVSSSQLSRSLLFYLISLYNLFWFWWPLNLFLILFVLYFFSGLRWGPECPLDLCLWLTGMVHLMVGVYG
jgi:hypothetical protein